VAVVVVGCVLRTHADTDRRFNVSKVQELATEARLDLSWLAALHYALKEVQGCITNRAKDLLLAPNSPRFDSSASEVTQEDICNLNNAFAIFHNVAKAVPGSPVDDVGHYLNKSAIVYAAAVVENFVKRAFDETFGGRNSDGALKPSPLEHSASLSSCISFITGPKAGKGKRRSYIKDFAVGSEGVSFLAGLRNNIVHAHGMMSNGELVRITPLLERVADKGFPIGFEKQFLNECRTSGRVWLHVVKVVVPCLRCAVDFISSAEAKFTNAAGGRLP
jgi:hypothetical protein